ncbi:cysteine synthase [Colletotrichum higginsianum]|nr:cysteine synthase [Colletotrichum higginsianum]
MGVSRVLKAARHDTRVVVLEPASTPVVTEGRAGAHGVEGIGIGFLPPLLDRALYDEARAVEEDEARAMCRRLAREEGIFAGVSTGLNAVAAIRLARELGPGKRVVTIACDSGLKYLNSDLFHGPQ